MSESGQGRRCRPRWRTAAVPSIADELTTVGTAVGPGQQAGSITERLVGSFWDRSAVFQRSTANNHGQAHERRVMTPVGVAKPSSVLIHFLRHQPYSGVLRRPDGEEFRHVHEQAKANGE